MHDGEAASTRRTGKERAWMGERFKAEWKVWRGIKLLVVFRAANVTVVTPQQHMALFYHFWVNWCKRSKEKRSTELLKPPTVEIQYAGH